MPEKTIYIDESGSHGFTNLSDDNSFYIITAVTIITDYLEEFKTEFDKIIKIYRDDDLLKSTTLKKLYNNSSNMHIVEQIIDSLIKLKFTTYSLVVDKRNIREKSWLYYQKTFYKLLHKLLYQNIFKYNRNIQFLSDTYLDDEFQDSFTKYIQEQSQKINFSLFDNINIQFLNKDRYVQIADWISGIIRSKLIGEPFGTLYDKIREKEIFILPFPYTKNSIIKNKVQIDKSESLDFAINFAQENLESIENEIEKNIMLFLMLNFWTNEDEYIFAGKIVEYLNTIGFYNVNENSIKNEHISKLRDQGFLIVSSSEGYKIPKNLDDCKRYAVKISNNFIPALHRLNKTILAYSQKTNTPIKELYTSLDQNILYEINEIIKKRDLGIQSNYF